MGSRTSSSVVTNRSLAGIALAALLASIILLASHEDDAVRVPREVALTSVTTTARDDHTSRPRILSRLREILRIREEAYDSRSPEDLRSIYSSDCPCLRYDEQEIMGLLARGRRWKAISTSIEVRSAERINDRVWTVIALLRSAALRIETVGGKLIRTEPPGSDLYRFTMVKPPGASQWLLGSVSDVEVR
jgi:hypothetical protein